MDAEKLRAIVVGDVDTVVGVRSVLGTTWFMNVSDGMYLLTTSASVGGASGDALLRCC